MSRATFTDLNQLTRVCLARDMADLLGLSLPRFFQCQRNGPSDFAQLPPMGDGTLRFSGRLVESFLIRPDIWRHYKEALEEHRRRSRRWTRQWYQSGPPWTWPLYAAPKGGEGPTIRVRELAHILRASQKALARLAVSHDWQLPPAGYRPLRGQKGRSDASLRRHRQDHESHDALNVTLRYAMRKLHRDLEAATQ
jgi:hypothetical protein